MSKFAEVVKSLLLEKKLTQKDLSKMSGVSEASLCRYISKGVQPRMDIVNNVATALDVSPDFLLGAENVVTSKEPFVETRNIVTRNRSQLTTEQKAEILRILFEEK